MGDAFPSVDLPFAALNFLKHIELIEEIIEINLRGEIVDDF